MSKRSTAQVLHCKETALRATVTSITIVWPKGQDHAHCLSANLEGYGFLGVTRPCILKTTVYLYISAQTLTRLGFQSKAFCFVHEKKIQVVRRAILEND